MSYILDALKKIEHEKNRRSRQGSRNNIAAELFQEDRRPSSRSATWKFLLLAILVSFATMAVIWFLQQGRGKGDATAVIRPEVAPSVPVKQAQAIPAPVQSPPVVTTVNREAVPDEDDSPARSDSRKSQVPRQLPKPQQPVIQAAQVPTDIKLSGIAFQDERSARRAVINGYLLKEGAIVSGSRITSIYADKVRFSSSAGQFEIKLDSVLPVEVRR